MSNVRISQLPTGSALTGTELVPVVQNGQTIQTTVSAIAIQPAQTQTFLTVGQQTSLVNSRYLAVGSGLQLVDGGAQGTYQINLTGAASSLNSAGVGIQVKTDANTLTPREITTGTGLTVSDGTGVSGNPLIGLGSFLTSFQTLSGSTGLVGVNAGAVTSLAIAGVSNQTSITNPDGSTGNPTVGLANNPVLPGNSGVSVPTGTTAQRAGSNGTLRYNTDLALFEGYANNVWGAITTGSGVTSVATGTGLTGGPITSTGTISIDITGVTAGSYGSSTQVGTFTVNAQGQLTSAANVSITASGIGAVASVSGTANEITASGTTNVTLSLPNALTFTSKTVTDGTFNMAAATVGSDTVTTNTASQTLTNKTISGSSNTLTNIGNSSLTNSSVTVGTTAISLGSSSLTLGGLTSVAVTQDPTTAFQLATKQYVDGLVSTGLAYHQPAQVATTQSLAAQTGGLVTYNNGASGVGATLTLTVALTTLDGYSLSNGDRIMVKDEINQAYNGVYTWATGGLVLTRSTDTNSYGPGTTQLSEGDYFFIQNGTVNKGNSYVCSTVGTITFGTTAITFAQFSTSQVYTGTSPIQVSGTVISLNTVPVASGGTNITSYATGDMLYASGSTTLAKLTLGTSGYVMTAGASAPQYVAQSTLSVGLATNSTNATNTAITANSTNADYYITVVSTNTGNLPQLVATGLTANPSTGKITSGVSGGTF